MRRLRPRVLEWRRFGSGIARLFGYSWETSKRVGIGLTQIGEFSFILAQVSLSSCLITHEIYNATLVASLLTILANATFFKFLKPEAAATGSTTAR